MIKKKYFWIYPVLILSFVVLFDRHFIRLGVPESWVIPLNFISFVYMVGLISLALMNKPYTYRKTNKLKVCVVVPVFNEDPATFLMVLNSLEDQTLKPSLVHIIDDGSSTRECHRVFKEWKKTATINAIYRYNRKNRGKREVQAIAFRANKDADVFATIDSDTVLDKNALKNGVRPFGNAKVTSVAGLLVGLNDTKNLLTRLVDLGFVSSFINGRAAWSKLNSVAVNCGGLAFYRADIVHKHLNEYINQTVLGKKAASGDDRILTNLALLEGWAVFQENSIGYTVLPEKLSHLVRQRIRWWRSFFWGGVWLIRRFSPSRLVWWLVTWQFVEFTFYTIVIASLVMTSTRVGSIPWGFILYLTLALSYIRSVRFLALDVPGRSNSQKWISFILAPLSAVLHFFICSVLQYYGLLTVSQSGWGTRKKVEVQI